MAFRLFAALMLLLLSNTNATITTEYLLANELNFTCTVLRTSTATALNKQLAGKKEQVMLLHGFPMYRTWWDPLLEYWDSSSSSFDEAVHAVACDLRGYSPGASPNDIAAYNYDVLASDVFALAAAAGFDTADEDGYHLIAHDHGAALYVL